MKKTYRLYPFAFFDRDGITARLEGMARKGWLLECATPLWIYRRAEPAEVRYAVCYTPQVSENDPEPPEGQQEFREFCAYTGWEYVCSGAQMQIFRNFQEDPTPIETDPRLEVASIHASYRKQRLGLHLLQILLALRSLDLLFSQPRSPLARPGSLLSCVFWLAVLFLNAGQFLLYWAWRRRATRRPPPSMSRWWAPTRSPTSRSSPSSIPPPPPRGRRSRRTGGSLVWPGPAPPC